MILVVSAVVLHLPWQADAVSFRLDTIPSLRVEEEWNSNVNNSSGNEVSSFGTRVTPALALRFTSPDAVMLQVSGSYEKVWYNKSEARNDNGDTWNIRVDSSGGWRLTPNLSMRPSVYYVNTTDSYRRTQLVPSGDPLIPPVSIANYGTSKTEDFGGGLGFAYNISPALTFGVGARYSEQRFSNDNAANATLTNSTTAGGDVSASYLVSPRTTVGLLFGGSHSRNENAPSTDVFSAGVIYGYQFSPVLRLDTTIGVQQIRRDSDGGTPSERESSPSGRFNLQYIASETFRATLYGSTVYSGGSGYGGATRQGTVGLTISQKFAREWSWNLGGAYQVSKDTFDSNNVDVTTMYANAGLQYRPLEWASLDLRGTMSRQTSDGQSGGDIDNYSAVLGFTIGKPYNLY